MACAGGFGAGRVSATTLYYVSDYTNIFTQISAVKEKSFNSGDLSNVKTVSNTLNVSDSTSNSQLQFKATASVSGTTNLGNLHFSSDAYGFGETAHGDASVDLVWMDTLTVVAPALSPNTPVLFSFEMDPKGSITAFVSGTGAQQGSYSENVRLRFGATESARSGSVTLNEQICSVLNIGGPCPSTTTAGPQIESGILTTYPGATISVMGSLDAGGDAQGNTVEFSCTGGNGPCFTNYGSEVKANFQDTINFYVQPLTPGASYTSASGTSYLPPVLQSVPEPSTAALLLVAAAGLLLAVRRHVYSGERNGKRQPNQIAAEKRLVPRVEEAKGVEVAY